MGKRKLPIGIQTFRQIREEGYYYVDKTAYARRIEDDAGKHYFLSRPRRFGKSLFVDTLKELYEGGESLFRGLAVHDGWDWSRRHRDAAVPGGHADPARLCGPRPRENPRERRLAVVLRRGRDGAGSAAVPDRLPDDRGCGPARRAAAVPAGVSEPGGAPVPPSRLNSADRTSGCTSPSGCARPPADGIDRTPRCRRRR